MRIAVWHSLPSGGANRAMASHIRGLVARGHTVEVWHPPMADTKYLPLSDLVVEHSVPLSDSDSGARARWPKLPFSSGTTDVRRQLNALSEHCAQCGDEISRGHFDILFAQQGWTVVAPPLPEHVNIPTVLYMQQPNRPMFEQTFSPGTLPWIGSDDHYVMGSSWRHPRWFAVCLAHHYALRLKAWSENRFARQYDVVLANSYFSRESILRAYGVEAKVCYLGVDTNKFVHRGLTREPFIVSLGELGPHKNVELYIRAMATIEPSGRPPLVWVANRAHPPYQAEMEALAEQLAVDFRIHVMLDDDAVVDILNRAWAMLYAPRLEPFGLAPLEANACGAPVVAVAEGGPRETVLNGINGLLVDGEAEAIGQAVNRILRNRELARRLGEGGLREVAEKWTEGAATNRIEQQLLTALSVDRSRNSAIVSRGGCVAK